MYLAATPVSEAVMTALQASPSLLAALPGGIWDDVPQSPTYPFQWFEIFSERDIRGFGGGGLPEMELRTHTFAKKSVTEAHAAHQLTIAALRDAALTITGYAQCGRVVYRETQLLRDQEILGEKVHEVVGIFTVWAEE